MGNLRTCPRCEYRSYEVLKTHAYCVNCNYSPDLLDQGMSCDDLPVPPWAFASEKITSTVTPPSEHPNFLSGGAA